MASPIPETTPSLLPKVPFREILWSKKVEIGRGSYAQVFELKHNITRSVYAAKELIIPPPIKNNTESNAAMKSGFFRICDSWSRLRHHNVVQFLGICYPSEDETGLPIMILEKMQGSVTSLLKEHDDIPLLVKLSILHDASLGLLYLHTHNPLIIHRDVSSNNIMLTPHLEAKITDPLIKTVVTERNKKTSSSQPSNDVQVDVLAFGIVILHVVTHQQPVPLQSLSVSGVEQYREYMDRITGDHSADLKGLIMACLEPNDKFQWCTPRFMASKIIDMINNMKEKCRKRYTRDGMDPLSWLAEIKQISLPTHIKLKVCG